MRSQPWDEARKLAMAAREISGLTAGIVGVGEIGRRVARICRNGFGMRVLGNQRRMDRLPPEAEGASLDRLIAQSDFLAQPGDGVIDRGTWKSLNARADITIPEAGGVSGTTTLRLAQLRDLSSVIGEPIEGNAEAEIDLTSRNGATTADITARAQNVRYADATLATLETDATLNIQNDRTSVQVNARASTIALQDASITRATITGRVDEPFDSPSLALAIDAPVVHRRLEQSDAIRSKEPGEFLQLVFGEGMQGAWSERTRVSLDGIGLTPKALARGGDARDRTLFFVPAQRATCLRDGFTRPFGEYKAGDPFFLRAFSQDLHDLVQSELLGSGKVFPKRSRLPAPLARRIAPRRRTRTGSTQSARAWASEYSSETSGASQAMSASEIASSSKSSGTHTSR